jgi:cell shape-determining protein MreC
VVVEKMWDRVHLDHVYTIDIIFMLTIFVVVLCILSILVLLVVQVLRKFRKRDGDSMRNMTKANLTEAIYIIERAIDSPGNTEEENEELKDILKRLEKLAE